MAESFSREVDEKSCVTFLLCDLGWYVQELDVQNGWEENTHTHTHKSFVFDWRRTSPPTRTPSTLFRLGQGWRSRESSQPLCCRIRRAS